MPLGLALLVFGTAGMVCGGLWGDWLVRRGRIDGLLCIAFLGSIGVLPGALALAFAPSASTCTAACCVFFFFVNLPIGLGPSSLQCMTPDSMRAQVSAFYICILNVVATAAGPTAIALCTDYLFKSPAAIDFSMALVATIVCPLATGLLFFGQQPYANAVLAPTGNPTLNNVRDDAPAIRGSLLGPSQSHN